MVKVLLLSIEGKVNTSAGKAALLDEGRPPGV
jgi:hypothetical protein